MNCTALHFTSIIFVLLLMIVSTTTAATAPTLNYQGRLTDSTGEPVENGTYQMVFRIYDAPSGGSAIWSSGTNAIPVTVTAGLFSVILGSADQDSMTQDIFSGQTLYLGIQVNGEPEFTPRHRVVATAYSLRANLSDDALRLGGVTADQFLQLTGGTLSGSLQIDFDNNGSDFLFSKEATGEQGTRFFQINNTSTPRVELQAYFKGGAIRLTDRDDDLLMWAFAEADFGGTIELYRNDEAKGLTLVGGGYVNPPAIYVSGPDNGTIRLEGGPTPSLELSDTGLVPRVSFDLAHSNPDSIVMLPDASIGSSEIADEPGVAQAITGIDYPSSVELTGLIQVIDEQSITVPQDGFVLAIASCQVTHLHEVGTPTISTYGVSDNAFSFPQDQGKTVRHDSAIPSGAHYSVVSVQKVFDVESGERSLFFLGNKALGANHPVVSHVTLTLVYFPVAYGEVQE